MTTIDYIVYQGMTEAQSKLSFIPLLSTDGPKNLPEGVSGAVQNLMAGVIGGLEIAVISPKIGLSVGLEKEGSILGGTVGFVGGALVGAVGLAGLLVGGTVLGLVSAVRGVAAIPQSVISPCRGLWWDENSDRWVFTDLSTTATEATDINRQDISSNDERTSKAKDLVAKIRPWVEEDDFDTCKALWTAEAKNRASPGRLEWEYVKVIGTTYKIAAASFLGSFESGIGVPSVLSNWANAQKAQLEKSKIHKKLRMDLLEAYMESAKIEAKYRKQFPKAVPADVDAADAASKDNKIMELERLMMQESRPVMDKIKWLTILANTASSSHVECQMVLFDQSVDMSTRQRRAEAILCLGEIFLSCPQPKEGQPRKREKI